LFALIKADYLEIPKIVSHSDLSISIIFLFLGLLMECVIWVLLLNRTNLNINYNFGIISHGLSIFSKYNPGKFWMFISAPSYISRIYRYPIKDLVSVYFYYQLIATWFGLLIGAIGLLVVNSTQLWINSIFITLIVLSIIITSKIPQTLFNKIILFLFKKDIKLPYVQFKSIIATVPYFLIYWFSFSFGFYFLCKALVTDYVSIYNMFAFPLAATIGVITIISPGGLGVREGVLVYYLSLTGLSTENAVIISVASRLWFLLGETFIFITGFVLERRSNKILPKLKDPL
jgi:uncharacterized membrane protein YbhN (UPF0104 family)